MAIKRFSGSFKTRDDVFDNITPNNMVQPKVSHPAGEWKPAAWLPVEWQGSASKDYFVISSGKVVAFDASGRIVPAGLAKKATTAAATVITYSSLDVSAKTEDIRTGEPLLANATMAVTAEDFLKAFIERGWISEADVVPASGGGDAFSGTTGNKNTDAAAYMALAIGAPIGVAAYDVYSWAGDAPASMKYTNYQKQHLIQFITEAQMKMPQLAATSAFQATIANTAWVVATHGNFPSLANTELTLTAANLRTLERYDRESDEVLYVPAAASVEGIFLGTQNCVPEINALTAANVATTLVVSGTQIEAAVVNRKNRIQDIGALGDYFFDAEVGILIVHTGFVIASAVGDLVDFYVYNSATSQGHQHIYCVGDVQPGDYLTFDSESNFTKLSLSASTLQSEICGRVLEIQSFPKSLMERVTTAWQGSSFDASMRMPGSATEGLPDNLTLAGQNSEIVGNRMVIANIRIL